MAGRPIGGTQFNFCGETLCAYPPCTPTSALRESASVPAPSELAGAGSLWNKMPSEAGYYHHSGCPPLGLPSVGASVLPTCVVENSPASSPRPIQPDSPTTVILGSNRVSGPFQVSASLSTVKPALMRHSSGVSAALLAQHQLHLQLLQPQQSVGNGIGAGAAAAWATGDDAYDTKELKLQHTGSGSGSAGSGLSLTALQWMGANAAPGSTPTAATPGITAAAGTVTAGAAAMLSSSSSGMQLMPAVPVGMDVKIAFEDEPPAHQSPTCAGAATAFCGYGGSGGSGASGGSSGGEPRGSINTKNRDAQRRFRQRQRDALAALETRVRNQEMQIAALHREKRMVEQHNEVLLKQLRQHETEAALRAQQQQEEEQELAELRASRAAAAAAATAAANGDGDRSVFEEPYRPHLCCLCGSAILQPQQLMAV